MPTGWTVGIVLGLEAMKLYACFASGNCMKPWLAMNQLGKRFDIEIVDVLNGQQHTAEYRRINPLGTVPFLVTDAGRSIGESNAMLWYLCEGTELMPQCPEERAQALQWMFFEQTRLEPFISPARFVSHIVPGLKAAREDEVAVWLCKAFEGLKRLDAHLQDQQFLVECGYSLADISVFGYGHVLDEAGLNPDDFPNVMRWIGDVRATKGFKELDQLGMASTRAA